MAKAKYVYQGFYQATYVWAKERNLRQRQNISIKPPLHAEDSVSGVCLFSAGGHIKYFCEVQENVLQS